MKQAIDRLQPMVATLVTWYERHERAFPWRSDPSPYRVWVSEIMLQQTRIEAALPYFERFMSALPTIEDLAKAPEELLMKLWEGLGYYSRVRNLQKAAQQVMSVYGGELPETPEELVKLPGIGEYTAGAIASIAFHRKAAAVDGNVLRVMARLLDEDGDVMNAAVRKRLARIVCELVPEWAPGSFNQGLMELGETICLPNTLPRCDQCPIRQQCAVGGTKRAAELPTRSPAKPRKIEKRVVFTILTNEERPRVLLHRRPKKGLLSGLWELPNVLYTEDCGEYLSQFDFTPIKEEEGLSGKHVFSHVEWILTGKMLRVTPFQPPNEYVLVTAEELKNIPIPTAFRIYIEQLTQLLFEEDVQ